MAFIFTCLINMDAWSQLPKVYYFQIQDHGNFSRPNTQNSRSFKTMIKFQTFSRLSHFPYCVGTLSNCISNCMVLMTESRDLTGASTFLERVWYCVPWYDSAQLQKRYVMLPKRYCKSLFLYMKSDPKGKQGIFSVSCK